MEGAKIRELDALHDKVNEIKEANGHLSHLYEAQIGELRQRLVVDKKKTETQADQIVNLAQRDAVIKQLKKEVTGLKIAIAKVKGKNKEMKVQLMMGNNEKENMSVSSVANTNSTKHSTAKKSLKPNSNTSRYCGDDEW